MGWDRGEVEWDGIGGSGWGGVARGEWMGWGRVGREVLSSNRVCVVVRCKITRYQCARGNMFL